MKQLLRHYPISLAVVSIIIYLSCFKPPQNSLEEIPNFDKVVHCSMYFCLSMLIWFEYIRTHRKEKDVKWWHGWSIGLIFPIALGFSMEIIQKLCTTYRAFEWGDVAANTTGAIIAGIFAAVYIRQHTS